MKHLYLLLLVWGFAKTAVAQQEIVDISTGYTNGSPLAYGSYDDTWLVRNAAGGTFFQPRVVMPDVWDSSSCSRWISPQLTANDGGIVVQDSGNFIYQTTFFICHGVGSASIEFNVLGADNEFRELRVNGFLYAFNFAGLDDHNPMILNHTITLNPAHVNAGTNTLTIMVRNRRSTSGSTPLTPSGMNICGRVIANTIGAGPNQTICAGSCVTIGQPAIRGTHYIWTNTSGAVIGNTAQITVCPTLYFTTYTLTSTNTELGCSTTDNVNVVTIANNPNFTVDNLCVPGAATFNIRAKPIVLNANLMSGFGEMYYIEKISGTYHNTSQGATPNPSCWWVYPNYVYFKGYNNGPNVNCNSLANGIFSNSNSYRITRGTWNNYCSWKQYSVVVNGCDLTLARQQEINNLQLDKQTPDLSYLKPVLADNGNKGLVYPNPTSGKVGVVTNFVGQGVIEVYSPAGILLQRVPVTRSKANMEVDLSRYATGTYIIKTISGDQITTSKVQLIR